MLPDHELRRLRAVAPDDAGLAALIDRRLAGEPLQYLEGTAAFGPFDLDVDERVLIPRPETEQLWELAVKLPERPPDVIVDMCTGSGALAIALGSSFPSATVHGSDLSEDAIAVAAQNGRKVGAAVEWHIGDVFEALPPELRGQIDLFVANPPYVARHEFSSLPDDVKREPELALIGGETGLEIIERICEELPAWLAPDGRFALEIGETQGARIRSMCAAFQVEVCQDLAGRDRFVIGRR